MSPESLAKKTRVKEDPEAGLLLALPAITAGQQTWCNIPGALNPLLMSEIAAHRPLVLICTDEYAVNRIMEALRFFLPPERPLLQFMDWGILAYDRFSASPLVSASRLATLAELPTLTTGILVTSIAAVMPRLCPPDYLLPRCVTLAVGQTITPSKFLRTLTTHGYRVAPLVEEEGQVAVRGSVVDLFPVGLETPVRIDLLDEQVDSLRLFDPDTQRSMSNLDNIAIRPATEYDISDAGIERFRHNWRKQFTGDPNIQPAYRAVSAGDLPAGIEYYLPLFFEHTGSLFDYLPKESCIVTDGAISRAATDYYESVATRYEQRCHDVAHAILPVDRALFTAQEITTAFARYPAIQFTASKKKGAVAVGFSSKNSPCVDVADWDNATRLQKLSEFALSFSGNTLIVAGSPARREMLHDHLKEKGVEGVLLASWEEFLVNRPHCGLVVGAIEQGFILPAQQLAVVSEHELFSIRVNRPIVRRRREKQRAHHARQDYFDLSIGDPVVHEIHGVGRYRGLQELTVNNACGEYLCLEYANEDKVYVPVHSLALVSRYVGADDKTAPLDNLNSNRWKNARKKALVQIRDAAAELLRLQAQRLSACGLELHAEDTAYHRFCDDFPFEETVDQSLAIDAVRADLAEKRPMDRLICGDVGFGKTEVAMRAAFVAVMSGKQVAMLVPTTLLAQQHVRNFRDRFCNWPVTIAEMSRFRKAKELTQQVEKLAVGQIDIVVGTHYLLKDTIRFSDLGLVILDEEHRFGVMQKERLKKLRATVNVLTMTATPIPRSLGIALAQLRDLSIIASPPEDRQTIETIVCEWDNDLITEAIQRELHRGGQVLFVHNDIRSIKQLADELTQLSLPVTIEIAHGQMRDHELERVMSDFYHQRFNLLLCTTIIESGLDIPTANTIIIHRADRFGLAQLHQLRGRVGRSSRKAYAYLLIPNRQSITREAEQRLAALAVHQELGVGFSLAMRDLEIRGSGEILGEAQSGHVQEIGLSLYRELLERTIKSGVHEDDPEKFTTTEPVEIDLKLPALLPKSYLPDVHLRLAVYKQIATAQNAEALVALGEELCDRFGAPTPEVSNLLRITTCKQQMTALGIRKIHLGKTGGSVAFKQNTLVSPACIIALVQQEPARYALVQNGLELRIKAALPEPADRLSCVESLLPLLRPAA